MHVRFAARSGRDRAGLRWRVSWHGGRGLVALAVAMVMTGCAVPLSTAPVSKAAPQSAPVTRSFSFAGSLFVDPLDLSVAPVPTPVSGRFTLSLHRDADTAGGRLDAMSLIIGGVAFTPANTAFDYDSVYDRLLVGGTLNGIEGVAHGTGDFFLSFRPATAAAGPSFAAFLYSRPSDPRAFLADSRIPPSKVVVRAASSTKTGE